MSSLPKLSQDLGRVEGKLDGIIEWIKARDLAEEATQKRLRRVENRQHWYGGIAAALGVLFGAGGGHWIKH